MSNYKWMFTRRNEGANDSSMMGLKCDYTNQLLRKHQIVDGWFVNSSQRNRDEQLSVYSIAL